MKQLKILSIDDHKYVVSYKEAIIGKIITNEIVSTNNDA
jgi:hypothetical protein